MSGITRRDRIKSEEIRMEWNVEEMIDDIQSYQLKWNQHVLIKIEYHAKHCNIHPKEKSDLGRPYHRWKDQFM